MLIDNNLRKALCDRIYEKRKPAALQLEQNVRRALESQNTAFVDATISELSRDFAYALRHPNYRNGGLIGLAAVAIALGQDLLPSYLDDIIQPILTCFGDADSRVRYYACESLYNVAKIAKDHILVYFNEIFDALCKLTADFEESVRTGANLVDQLMRDIVVETTSKDIFVVNKGSPQIDSSVEQPEGPEQATLQKSSEHETRFTLTRFMPLLIERIYVLNPSTRMFLVQWIMLLDSIPELELVKYIPEFLEGLLLFLSDTHKEVRTFTKTCLDTLLNNIKSVASLRLEIAQEKSDSIPGIDAGVYRIGEDTYISYSQIVNILLSKMDPSQDDTKLVSLGWIDGILSVSPVDVMAKLGCLVVLLIPALSDPVNEVRDAGNKLSDKILGLIEQHSGEIDASEAVKALGRQLENDDKVTRLASLNWLTMIYNSSDQSGLREEVLNRLLSPLGDPSDEVVHKDLELMALIYRDASATEFMVFGRTLITFFKQNQPLFLNRGKLVLLQLCMLLSPVRIFETMAGICGENLNTDKEEADSFYLLVIQNLNNILLTAQELHPFRIQLTQLHTIDGARLFTTLFNSWIRNSVAVLALCLLAGAYEPAFEVLGIFARNDISVSTLIQVDKLIQYIEGPVFAVLRLHLLEPQNYPFLYKTLYGLLMVLPQSPAFTTLHTRLHSVSPICTLPFVDSKKEETPKELVDWNQLLNKFRRAH